MTVRHYSSSAGKMILQLGVSAVATSLAVDTTAGLPGATPFTLLVDAGLPTEEIVTVNQVSGNTLVVIRGEDGTSAQPHASGAVVRHGMSARDLRDSRDHENASTGVHGITGSVVGTTDNQTLTNKNLAGAGNVFPASLATDVELTAAVAAEAGARAAADSAHAAATSAHGVSGALVGTTDTQTLTGKTIDGASNTLTVPQSQVTGLSADLTSLDGRLDVIEGNLGSQTTFVASSAAKDGKRIHWGTASITTVGASGDIVTHGAGFTPSVVHVSGNSTWRLLVDLVNGTTFRVRAYDSSNTPVNLAVSLMYFCGE